MPDNYYPKQPLSKAIERGMGRNLGDSTARQRVRMGDEPMERQREDYSIRVGKQEGRKMDRGPTVGQMIDEDRAASSRYRRSTRGHSRDRSSR